MAGSRRSGGGSTTAGQGRREAIVRAAMGAIAASGVGGLRVRAVAEAAGVHHATLLYHFPSRLALVRAVVPYLEADLRQPRLPRDNDATLLRRYFDEVGARLGEDRASAAALVELTLAARRDPDLAKDMARLYAGWRYHVAGILGRGVAHGELRGDIDVGAVSQAIVSHIMGIALEAAGGAPRERVALLLDLALAALEAGRSAPNQG
jgi:AcrR family transcriptional regulator